MLSAQSLQPFLEPVRRTTLREVAAGQIRNIILEGRLKPGDRLPSERELVDRLCMSRASVREALRSLEFGGLLEVRAGEGAFVREVPVEAVLDPLSTSLVNRRSLLELLETRQILEPEIAALAAERAGPGDVAEMEQILSEIGDRLNAGRYDFAVQSIVAFHRAITRATGNRLMQRVMDAIGELLIQSMRETLRIPGRPARSLEGHRQILAAIRRGDAAAARSAMSSHIRGVEQAIVVAA